MILKEIVSLDRKVFLRGLFKITILQILFVFVTFILSGAGHGSYIQYPIFYSWLFLPIIFQWPMEYIGGNLQIIFIFLVPFIFYLFSFGIFIALLLKKINRRTLNKIIFFHFLIAVLIIVDSITKYGLFFPSEKTQLISLIISLSLISLFWCIFLKISNCNWTYCFMNKNEKNQIIKFHFYYICNYRLFDIFIL